MLSNLLTITNKILKQIVDNVWVLFFPIGLFSCWGGIYFTQLLEYYNTEKDNRFFIKMAYITWIIMLIIAEIIFPQHRNIIICVYLTNVLGFPFLILLDKWSINDNVFSKINKVDILKIMLNTLVVFPLILLFMKAYYYNLYHFIPSYYVGGVLLSLTINLEVNYIFNKIQKKKEEYDENQIY